MDVKEIDDEEIEDKEKEEISQEEEVTEEEEKEKLEKEESHESENEDSPRSYTKTPSRWVQKNHLEIQIIGDKYLGVKIRRNLLYDEEQSLLSIVEPKTFNESCKCED